jgi:hypothetical protein
MTASYNQSQKCEEITLISSKNTCFLEFSVLRSKGQTQDDSWERHGSRKCYSPFLKVCLLGRREDITGVNVVQSSLAFHGLVLPSFANSQSCPRNQIHYSDPSMDRSIKIFWQLKQVFNQYCMMFKELKGKKKHLLITMMCAKSRKTQKKY